MKSPAVIPVLMLLGGSIARAAPQNMLEGAQIQHLDDEAIRGLVTDRPEMKQDPNFFHDACHKTDSQTQDGFIWPCASVIKIEERDCPKKAETAEERKAQRDCFCGSGSSWLADAKACSACKAANGLQSESRDKYWQAVYAEMSYTYCQNDPLDGNFGDYMGNVTRLFAPGSEGERRNRFERRIVDPREYYGFAGVEVPKHQGPGSFTAVSGSQDKRRTNGTVPDLVPVGVANEVTVPCVAIVKNDAESGTSNTSTTEPTPSVSVSHAESEDKSRDVIIINHIPYQVYIVYVVIQCLGTTGSSGQFEINFWNDGVDENIPIAKVQDKEQFDQVKELPDASTVKNCEEEIAKAEGSAATVIAKDDVVPGTSSPELPPPLAPVVPSQPDGSGRDDCDDNCAIDGNRVTKVPSPTSNGSQRPGATATDNALPVCVAEGACEEGDVALPSTGSTVTNTADVPAEAPGAGPGGNAGTLDEDDACKGHVAAPGGTDGAHTPAKDTLDGPAKAPSAGIGSGDTPKDTANVPANAPAPDHDAGGPASSEREIIIPIGATDAYNPVKDTADAAGNPPSAGPSGPTNPANDADGPAHGPNAGTAASHDMPAKETISTDSPTRPSESGCQPCVCDNVCANGSGETKTGTPNGPEPDSCKDQRERMELCGTEIDCLCNTGFFDSAIACAREKPEHDCAAKEYYTLFYLRLKYGLCEKKNLGNNFTAAYEEHQRSWRSIAPFERDYFN